MAGIFASGKRSLAECDRCSRVIPYQDLTLEWTGFRVCAECNDNPKHPQLGPWPQIREAIALRNARPREHDPSITTSTVLDTYQGVAAACGIRLLNTFYSGACLNVRRSSDDATQDIGFRSGILNTTAMATFLGSDTGYVTAWYDQSGNGRHFVQATTANQPTYVAATFGWSTPTVPAIRFGGGSITLATSNFSLVQPCTYFVAGKSGTQTASTPGLVGSTQVVCDLQLTPTVPTAVRLTAGTAITVAGTLTSSFAAAGVFNAYTSAVYVNGSYSVTAGNGGSSDPGGVQIAQTTGNPGVFDIGEVFVFNRALPAMEINTIMSSAGALYGFSVADAENMAVA